MDLLKVSKQDADYKEGDKEKNCGNCAMFHPWLADCDMVRGWITSAMVCKFWEKK